VHRILIYKMKISNFIYALQAVNAGGSNSACTLAFDFKAVTLPLLCERDPNSKLDNVPSPLLLFSPHFKTQSQLPTTTTTTTTTVHRDPPRPLFPPHPAAEVLLLSAAPAMPSDGFDDELGSASVAPSPVRFELQDDPAFWKDNNVQVGFPPPRSELSPPLHPRRSTFRCISGSAPV
jgi:hypothetical protein